MFFHYHEHTHCSLFWLSPTQIKYSQEHQMCNNLQLKIVPNKCTFISKHYFNQLFKEIKESPQNDSQIVCFISKNVRVENL